MPSLKALLALCAATCATVVYSADVHYTMDITWEEGSPDGNKRYMIFNNGQFPGPDVIADEGDEVEITVRNHMPFNTTIHWHGIDQLGTPWSDGVPGLTQKPIETGETFVYRWIASPFGTYWYHAHSRATLQDGLYGSIHIRPKPGTPSPFSMIAGNATNSTKAIKAMERAEADPQLILLSDWDHLTSWEYIDAQSLSGADIFCVDSVLIGGKGNVNCLPADELDSLVNPALRFVLNGSFVTDRGCIPPDVNTQGDYKNIYSLVPPGLNDGCVPTTGSMATYEVDAHDKWASLNFINAASLKALIVSVDEHPLWVYAIDGEYITPRLVETFYLFNGARVSAMVKLDKTPGDYTIRAADQGGDQIISGYATLSYKRGKDIGPSKPYIDYGGANTTADVVNLGLEYVKPFIRDPPALVADATHHLSLGRINSSWQWTLDGSKLYTSDRDAYNPLLFNPNQPDGKDTNLSITTTNGSWVDIIMHVEFNSHNPLQPPHVIHKHSNKAYLIGTNLGRFNWTTVAEAQKVIPEQFNIEGAPFRDTFVTDPAGESWMVIRYQVVNPGPFLLHCHIETHLEGGMAVALLDGIEAWPTVPPEYQI